MATEIRLHDCADLAQVDTPEQDAQCLQVLQAYTAYSLGRGMAGRVMHSTLASPSSRLRLVHDSAQPLAVKMLVGDAALARREIYAACAVTRRIVGGVIPSANSKASLTADTRIGRMFCQTYGYLKCGPPPESWQSAIVNYATNAWLYQGTNWYLVMELGQGETLAKTVLSLDEMVPFVFELLFGLAAAQEATDFYHNDLHDENVLATRHSQSVRNYAVGSVSYTVSGGYYPKIIDFGRSTFGEATTLMGEALPSTPAYDAMVFSLAMGALAHVRTNGPLRDWFNELNLAASVKGATLLGLLQSPLFAAHCVAPSVKRPRIDESQCQICASVATRVLEHAPRFAFCDSDWCVRQLGPVARIVV